MLFEPVTTEKSQKEKPQTFQENKDVAKRGEEEKLGDARENIGKELGRSVISNKNNLDLGQNKLDFEEK